MDKLQSPPAILIEAAKLLSDDRMDLGMLSELIAHDPALTARLLDLGGAAGVGIAGEVFSIRQILLRMGVREVKVLVLSSIMRQFFDKQPLEREVLRGIWRRSVQTAIGALRLAELCNYPNLTDTYIAGLLAKIGQFVLASREPLAYGAVYRKAIDDADLARQEASLFGVDHCKLGAELAVDWELAPSIGEAIQSQLTLLENPCGNRHPLSKIVCLASKLTWQSAGEASDFVLAQQLLGLTEDLVMKLKTDVRAEIASYSQLLRDPGLAESVGGDGDDIARHAEEELLHSYVEQLGQVLPYEQVWSDMENVHELDCSIRRSIYVLEGLEVATVFHSDYSCKHLSAATAWHGRTELSVTFTTEVGDENELLNQAIKEHRCVLISEPASVLEAQLTQCTGSRQLILSPVFWNHALAGVLVLVPRLETSVVDLDSSIRFRSLRAIIGRGLRHLAVLQHRNLESEVQNIQNEARIRSAVHEASNPLSVIGTYLEFLKGRHECDGRDGQEILFIQQEIERVGDILLKLRDSESSASECEYCNLETTLKKIVSLFQQSLCISRGVKLALNLGDRLPGLLMDQPSVKQVLINLIKNAIEALERDQTVEISTTGALVTNGKLFCEVIVADNGPGIPETVLKTLFSPIDSPKGQGHSGLGLSIVKGLMDEAGGQIICRTSAGGSRFQLLFPATWDPEVLMKGTKV